MLKICTGNIRLECPSCPPPRPQWIVPGCEICARQINTSLVKARSKMECGGWEHDRRTNKGTYALVPPALDTISELYKHVLKFVDNFPFKKRLVLYFVYRGTRVKVDLGDARAAGVVCVLGIGVGLGSLLVYRLYYNYLRPILDKLGKDSHIDPSVYAEDDCCFYSGSCDSAATTEMGNTETGRADPPPVHYDSEYGVAIARSNKSEKIEISRDHDERVRLRRKGRRQSSLNSERDSAIGGGASELGQSFYSDGVNRDSFYSTAESGFENAPDNMDDWSSIGEGFTLSRYPSLSQSLQVNFSPKSLNNKNARYGQNADDVCYGSDEQSSQTVKNGDALENLNYPSEDEPSGQSSSDNTKHNPEFVAEKSDKGNSLSVDCDVESLLSGETESLGDWSYDEDRDAMSPLPQFRDSMSDSQFKQSLMQRLREWSSMSVEEKSSSVAPETYINSRFIRRSRSLDRQISEVCIPDDVLFDNELIDFNTHTTENLEHIEDELHDIQGEFSMITSQLSDLIHRGDEEKTRKVREVSPMARRACDLVQRARTRWERSPSLSYSDSERSSQDGNTELAWDLGDIGDDELPKTMRNHRRKLRLRRRNTLIPEMHHAVSVQKRVNQSSSCDSSPLRQPLCGWNQNGPDQTGDDLEVDSAPADTSQQSSQQSPHRGRLKNIRDSVNIQEYAQSEWKGDTPTANTMRQAYAAIPSHLNCHHMKQIRGDNYCAVRAALYQILSEGHKVNQTWPGIVDTVNKLHMLYQDPACGLQQWNFANRLPFTDENRLTRMCECVLTLYSTIEEICKLPSYEERAESASNMLNTDPEIDLELMEGVKLLMALTSIDLYNANEGGEEVPVFVWLMFARDSCQNVSQLIKNHLNSVGDDAGLEQVEMCLLGHTLGSVIQVVRLHNFDQEDFTCKFPDDSSEDWPVIKLLAEDDRHYNVPIPSLPGTTSSCF